MPIVKEFALAVLALPIFVLVSACDQPSKALRDVPLRNGGVVKGLALSDVVDGTLQVEYRSSQSIKDCASIQAEVRELWESFLKMEADRSGAVAVLVWPEDKARSSRAFKYSRQSKDSNAWKEESGFLRCE